MGRWSNVTPTSPFITSQGSLNIRKGLNHRVQKSDAGVGIGTLIGDRDSLARKYRNWFAFAHNRFMFFDPNKTPIQALGEIPPPN